MSHHLRWDQHLCLPLQPDADVSVLLRTRHQSAGTFLSVNAGYAPHSFADATALLRGFRANITTQEGLTLADNVADIEAITGTGGVAVMFDLEDSAPLDGDLANLRPLYELGVRTMLPTYNHANAAGGGCLDAVDEGLTAWGRALVQEMNTVGVVPDGSHCGRRSALDISATTTGPMIYSHSCMNAVWEHPRNITDEQARECAATDGVVGITGVGAGSAASGPDLTASSSEQTPRHWRR